MKPNHLTTKQAAEALGVTGTTIRRYIAKGILQSYRIGPRGLNRISRESVEMLMKGTKCTQ